MLNLSEQQGKPTDNLVIKTEMGDIYVHVDLQKCKDALEDPGDD